MKSLGVYVVVALLLGVVLAAVMGSHMPVFPRSGAAWTATHDRIMKQLDQVGDETGR